MDKLEVSWVSDANKIIYFVNNIKVGVDDLGFSKILEIIKQNKNDEVIIKICYINSLGGDDLQDTLPFKHRFDELKIVLGKRKLVYEFSPNVR